MILMRRSPFQEDLILIIKEVNKVTISMMNLITIPILTFMELREEKSKEEFLMRIQTLKLLTTLIKINITRITKDTEIIEKYKYV